MESEQKMKEDSHSQQMRKQFAIVTKGKNLLKTVGSQFPIASIATQMMDQIEAHETDVRLGALESDVKALHQLKALERAAPQTPPQLHDWPTAVAEYSRRTIQLAVRYDGGFHSPEKRGQELIQPLVHACIIGPQEFLTCKEALDLTKDIVETKRGKAVAIVGLALYEFEFEPPDDASGLSVCRLGKRDEERWQEWVDSWREKGLGELKHRIIPDPIKFTLTPWRGQELGFVHAGEAADVLRGDEEFSKLQFDTSVISHFRMPRNGAIKTFVTSVLPGRVDQVGVAVFSREGSLLGIQSDMDSFPSDVGRRAIVRTLLGHSRFMKTIKKSPPRDG